VTDAGRLQALFDIGTLLHPLSETPGPVDLARALASRCGVDLLPRSPQADRVLAALPASDHYVFVIIDGLGMNVVESLSEDAFLRHHLRMELRTVYPSSTAPTLTSYATGTWPGTHAVPGWWTYLPDAGLTSTILPFILRSSEESLRGRVDPRAAYPHDVLMPMMQRETRVVTTQAIANGVSSTYFSGGAQSIGYERLDDAVHSIVMRVGRDARPSYTYFYVPFVDAAEHAHGVRSPEVRRTLRHVQRSIERLAEQLEGRAIVVVTADHGLIDVPQESRQWIMRDDPLMRLLSVPPSCEPRCVAFHVREGELERFAEEFRERFGAEFALLSLDEADELRLFGPDGIAPETRRRLGDYIAVPYGEATMVYEPDHDLRKMVGFHGGLTPDEMRTPLIIA
jgi:hypothetical protein